MNRQLKLMLEEFLSEKRLSTGGWAKPTLTDMIQLNDIIYELLILKFELDPDGDLPISYILTDKSEEELPLYVSVKHIHKVTGQKEWIKTLSALNLNRRIAEDRFQVAFRIFTDLTSEDQ